MLATILIQPQVLGSSGTLASLDMPQVEDIPPNRQMKRALVQAKYLASRGPRTAKISEWKNP